VKNADIFIIALNQSKATLSWAWYYEAGAIWHNIYLESTALQLSANVIFNSDLKKLTGLFDSRNIDPLILIQAGEKYGVDEVKPVIAITSPEQGFVYVFGQKMHPSENTIIIGRIEMEVEVEDGSLLMIEYLVNGRLIGENYNYSSKVLLPFSICTKCNLEVITYDYFGNRAKDELAHVKII